MLNNSFRLLTIGALLAVAGALPASFPRVRGGELVSPDPNNLLENSLSPGPSALRPETPAQKGE
jgi:hypothetical protein